jgi:hypothetical protein
LVQSSSVFGLAIILQCCKRVPYGSLFSNHHTCILGLIPISFYHNPLHSGFEPWCRSPFRSVSLVYVTQRHKSSIRWHCRQKTCARQ